MKEPEISQAGGVAETTHTAVTSEGDPGASGTEQEYVLDKIVTLGWADDGTVWYRLRWFGYAPSADTWHTAGDIPANLLTRYYRQRRLHYHSSEQGFL